MAVLGSTTPLTTVTVTVAAAALVACATALKMFGRGGRCRVGSALPREKGAIYLDYAATCPIYPDVARAMVPYLFDHWGNPSSAHAYGEPCRKAVALARERIARMLRCDDASEIIFCSCGSEADNWAIRGAMEATGRTHVVTSAIEHPAILECVKTLEEKATIVGCDARGFVSAAEVAEAVRPGETAVVSVMLANNEVGSVVDVKAIVDAVKAKDPLVVVHADAAQAVGKIPVDVKSLGVDALTLVGHKFGAPKGVAALYVKRPLVLPSFLRGGGQEEGRRAGTEAVPNVVALGEAAQVWIDQQDAIIEWSTAMRDRLLRRLRFELRGFEDRLYVNGPLAALLSSEKDHHHHTSAVSTTTTRALPNVLSFAVAGVPASKVLHEVRDSVAASASAACHSDSTSVSSVLLAVGVPEDVARGTFRLSVGRHTTPGEVDRAAKLLAAAIRPYL